MLRFFPGEPIQEMLNMNVRSFLQCAAADRILVGASMAFSRFAVPATYDESLLIKILWALVLGMCGAQNMQWISEGQLSDYALLLGVQAFSYLIMLGRPQHRIFDSIAALAGTAACAFVVHNGLFLQAALVGISAAVCIVAHNMVAAGHGLIPAGGIVGLSSIALIYGQNIVEYMLPVREFIDAFKMLSEVIGHESLMSMTSMLLIVTVNCQVPLGFLGISFIRAQQIRKNTLLKVGEGQIGARDFGFKVLRFILAVAIPYMIQRVLVENMNSFVFSKFALMAEKALRLDSVFPPDIKGDTVLAALGNSNMTMGAYADAYNSVVSTSYDVIGRKLFSFPKLALLPGMLQSKPILLATLLPVTLAFDFCKSNIISFLSAIVQDLNQQTRKLASRRQRIEQHDAMHDEHIRLGNAANFTQYRWNEVTSQLQVLNVKSTAVNSVIGFVDWLWWQDFMAPGIEVCVAFLLEIGQLANSDVFLFERVIEDAMDFVLTRTRMQAELDTFQTNLGLVQELRTAIDKARHRNRVECHLRSSQRALGFANFAYSRGQYVHVQIPELELLSGKIYAVTGANGAGKSTALAIVMGCRHEEGMVLPAGTDMKAGSRISVPSRDIVMITQQLYCPLFIKPIEWLLQMPDVQSISDQEMQMRTEQIAHLSAELMFQHSGTNTTHGEGLNTSVLHLEKEDWYAQLSGGQKVKVEFMRKVFLRSSCPDILLLDEAFAPLDPQSRAAVQNKLKTFCGHSIILVIHHTEPGRTCLHSAGFFDGHLDFANGTAELKDLC